MSSAAPAPVRVGVMGGGLIAQAIHLPLLARMPERFALAALADPSRPVREALAARHGLAAHADWRTLLDPRHALEAVVVCPPDGSHAEVALASLEAGLHVFVETAWSRPCGARAIAARARAANRVAQVGCLRVGAGERRAHGRDAHLAELEQFHARIAAGAARRMPQSRRQPRGEVRNVVFPR